MLISLAQSPFAGLSFWCDESELERVRMTGIRYSALAGEFLIYGKKVYPSDSHLYNCLCGDVWISGHNDDGFIDLSEDESVC